MSAPRLLDQVRQAARTRHLSLRTERVYVRWIVRFVRHPEKRHPREMGASKVRGFLSHLATDRNVSASTQNQALAALLFLYRDVLDISLPPLGTVVRARRPVRLPVVLTREEVHSVLFGLRGTHFLIAGLLYGSGLRLPEALRLRVKDLDFERFQLTVRDGKGAKDRVTMLPRQLEVPLREHLSSVAALHRQDRADGFGAVYLPRAGAEVPWRRDLVGLAVCLPSPAPLHRPLLRSRAPPPPVGVGRAATRRRGGPLRDASRRPRRRDSRRSRGGGERLHRSGRYGQYRGPGRRQGGGSPALRHPRAHRRPHPHDLLPGWGVGHGAVVATRRLLSPGARLSRSGERPPHPGDGGDYGARLGLVQLQRHRDADADRP